MSISSSLNRILMTCAALPALVLVSCASHAGEPTSHSPAASPIVTVEDYFQRIGEPTRMEILADGRSVVIWQTNSDGTGAALASEYVPEPQNGCALRLVVNADNTIAHQRIEQPSGSASCPFFEDISALGTPAAGAWS